MVHVKSTGFIVAGMHQQSWCCSGFTQQQRAQHRGPEQAPPPRPQPCQYLSTANRASRKQGTVSVARFAISSGRRLLVAGHSQRVVAHHATVIGRGHEGRGVVGAQILPAVLPEPFVEFGGAGPGYRIVGARQVRVPWSASRAGAASAEWWRSKRCCITLIERALAAHESIELGHQLQRGIQQTLELRPLLVIRDEPLSVSQDPLGALQDAAQNDIVDCAVGRLRGTPNQQLLLGARRKLKRWSRLVLVDTVSLLIISSLAGTHTATASPMRVSVPALSSAATF